MANRRMFSLDVVDTDRFLDMSASAQALYFHLGMRADDDGFVSSPRKIAKASNCGLDDLTLLAAKGFIIPFAMELNIPIIALSQLNRVSEMRQDKVPTMGELREAGDIEQDASIILLMWNIVDDKKGLKVEKNRQGILSTEVLRFDGDNMQFIETDESIKEAAKGFRKAEEPTPFD